MEVFSKNQTLLMQVDMLEKQSQRAVREHILGDTTALQRIKDIDAQIAALRAQLT